MQNGPGSWPGAERRDPPRGSLDLGRQGRLSPGGCARRRPSSEQRSTAAHPRRGVRRRGRTTPSSPTVALGVRRRRRGRESEPPTCWGRSRPLPVKDAYVRRRPLHAGARALRRPGPGGTRAAPRDRPRGPRARLDARRAGLPPVAGRLLALDARGAPPPFRAERGTGRRCESRPAPARLPRLAMLLGIYVEIALRRSRLARGPVSLLNRTGSALDARSPSLRRPVPGSLIPNYHVIADV